MQRSPPFIPTTLSSPPQAQERQKLQQEMDLLRKLRAMSADEIKALQQKLSPQQLQQLISRIKYLQQVEQQHGSVSASASAGADAGSNMILSGANRIRSPGDQNAVSGTSAGQPQGTVATASATTMSPALSRRAQYIQAMMAAAKKRMATVTRPMEMLRKYQSYQKKSRSAMMAGCQYPMAAEGGMETFMAFSGGGCSTGGAICLMNGQSCVDVGMSIMCCPAGYTSGTLDMMNYMRQMEGFMAQFQ